MQEADRDSRERSLDTKMEQKDSAILQYFKRQ